MIQHPNVLLAMPGPRLYFLSVQYKGKNQRKVVELQSISFAFLEIQMSLLQK
uniref:Uncharacterized protein n=1 Tax=Serinus canaria TaxID=9135 RepID=A0A8C9NAH5_SERCA